MTETTSLLIQALVLVSVMGFGVMIGWFLRESVAGVGGVIAVLLFAAVLVLLAVYWANEHQPQGYAMPLVKANAAQGDEAAANRLFTPCPITPANIPFPEERKT